MLDREDPDNNRHSDTRSSVTATDPWGPLDDGQTQDVTITIKNVNEAPMMSWRTNTKVNEDIANDVAPEEPSRTTHGR